MAVSTGIHSRPSIFLLDPVTFETNEKDPFAFDHYASDKVAPQYIPFSGTVRKPTYFYFVSYVNYLLSKPEFRVFSLGRKRDETKIRLEKLLVYGWKLASQEEKKDLKGKSVIGNSYDNINPFDGSRGSWVKQSCFLAYSPDSIKALFGISMDQFWDQRANKKEIIILREFLQTESPDNFHVSAKRFLDRIKKNYKQSLFINHLLKGRQMMIKDFRKKLESCLKSSDTKAGKLMGKMVQARTIKQVEKLYDEILSSAPFLHINNWCTSVTRAIDHEIEGRDSLAQNEWKKCERLFNNLDNRDKAFFKSYQPNPEIWFQKDMLTSKYEIISTGSKKYESNGWESMCRRADKKHFFTFRLNALESLAKELLYAEGITK